MSENERKTGLTVRVVALVILVDIVQFVILVSFKKVSDALPPLPGFDVGALIQIGWLAVQTPWLWLAMAGMVTSFVLWPAVLAALDLSVAFPLGSMSFVMIPVLSIVFLGEDVGALRWFGIAVITSGIAWLSVTERKDRRAAAQEAM